MPGRNKQNKKSETLVDENDYPILEGLENLLSERSSKLKFEHDLNIHTYV